MNLFVGLADWKTALQFRILFKIPSNTRQLSSGRDGHMKVITPVFGVSALALMIGTTDGVPDRERLRSPRLLGLLCLHHTRLPINPAADGAFNPMSSNVD